MSFFGSLIASFLDWIKSLFWQQEMELTLVGLQNSGKTTLVNVIAVHWPFLAPCFDFLLLLVRIFS